MCFVVCFVAVRDHPISVVERFGTVIRVMKYKWLATSLHRFLTNDESRCSVHSSNAHPHLCLTHPIFRQQIFLIVYMPP